MKILRRADQKHMELQKELAVRRVKEGASSALVQSGLQDSWWAEAMVCYFYLRTVQDLPVAGQIIYEGRFISPFHGPMIPFGAELKFYPISSEDLGRVHQFCTQILLGLFNCRLERGVKLDW